MGRPAIAGNTRLIDYGIQTEESDYRAHVGFRVGAVYLFETAKGAAAIDPTRHKLWQAGQRGVGHVTGEGYNVPWQEIPGIVEVMIPDDLLTAHWCEHRDDTSPKGRKAMAIAWAMVKRGLVPYHPDVHEVRDEDLQIKGHDLVIIARLVMQVKCDYFCGSRERGGTGYIKLQTRECNPLGLH